MGYQNIKLEKGWSIFSVTFKDVGGEKYSLDDIIVCDASGTPIDNGKTAVVQMQKIDADGSGRYENQTYTWKKYSDAKGLGWYSKVSTRQSGTTLDDSEGIAINNVHTEAVYLRFSGEVAINPVSMSIPLGWSLIGNMTPAELNLDDILVCDKDGNQIDNGKTAVVQMQKIDADGSGRYENQTYTWKKYSDAKGLGWYSKVSTRQTGTTLKPGEGAALNNVHTGPVWLKFKSPISK